MDNKTCFTQSDFSEYTTRKRIKVLHIAPYHSSSNGQAEKATQTFKLGMKKWPAGTLLSKLSHSLFHYGLTPHAATGVPPAELLMNRQLMIFMFGPCYAQSERPGTTTTTEAENST